MAAALVPAPCPGRSCRTRSSSGRYENNTSRDSACRRRLSPFLCFFQNAWWTAVFAKILGVFLSFLGFSVSVLFCFGTPTPLITYKIDSWL